MSAKRTSFVLLLLLFALLPFTSRGEMSAAHAAALGAGDCQTIVEADGSIQAAINAAANGSVITNTAWISDGVAAPLARAVRTTLRAADLSPSTKEVSVASAVPGDLITYTIFVRNAADVAASARVTDTLPAGLAYVPDTLFASSGNAAAQDGVIAWQGVVLERSVVIVRFVARVEGDVASGSLIVNEALIRGGAGVAFPRSAPLAIGSATRPLHLPLVMKSAG